MEVKLTARLRRRRCASWCCRSRARAACCAKTSRCCGRSPASSVSCWRTSGCSGSAQEQEQLAQELRLQTSSSELKALRAQINPHFLFNALNAIASLIHTDPARADAAVEQLAEVFRYTLRRSDSEWAPLDQELAFARAYLDVEQARFGHRLTFAIDSDHRRRRRRCRRCCCRRCSRTP